MCSRQSSQPPLGLQLQAAKLEEVARARDCSDALGQLEPSDARASMATSSFHLDPHTLQVFGMGVHLVGLTFLMCVCILLMSPLMN